MKFPITPARALGVLAIAGLVSSGAWGVERWRAAARQEAAAAWQRRVESVGYYRVKASYTVKDTGERVDFDYVAACATVVTMYRDGDRSVDTPFGVAPKTFILPTRDGHAIQLVTPEACNHEAEEGWIPPDLIPLTIYYDDVNNLRFGWGYTSQDAYDNARSRMNFEGATVTAATYADFMTWRAKAESEFKPLGQIRSPWGYSYEQGTGVKVARGCHFYTRAPVFAEGKPALTAEWERRGRPEFWVSGNGVRDPEFWRALRWSEGPYSYVTPRTKAGAVGTIQNYSSQRWGKEHYGRDRTFPPNEVYPYLPISLSSTPPPGLDATVFPTKVLVSEDWKGLAACGVNDPAIDDAFFYHGRFNRSPGRDDAIEPVGERTRPFLANDTVVTELRTVQPQRFFQRDEFVLTQGPTNLEGIMP